VYRLIETALKFGIVSLGGLTIPLNAQERVISLDYCADQYVLALAERQNIVAVSPSADSEYSYLASRSSGLAQIRPSGEEVLFSRPDLVVRQWGGGFGATAYLARFSTNIAQVLFGANLEIAAVNLGSIGESLGESEKAQKLIEELKDRLTRVRAPLEPQSELPRAIYVTPGGLTTGADTFVHEVMIAAGVINMAADGGQRGWRELNLEAIALDPPDLVIAAFFDLRSARVNHWSVARHKFLREVMEKTPTVMLPAAQLACSAWFFMDAVESIYEAAQKIRVKGGG